MELSQNILKKVDKSTYLFDIRKLHKFANNRSTNVLTPQEKVATSDDISSDLLNAVKRKV